MTADSRPPFGAPAVTVCVLTCAVYLLSTARLRRRGDSWPWPRDCAFAAGGAVLAWGLCGPLPGAPFSVHALRHLLVGMAAPALFVMARPLTLTLRVLPPGRVRRGLLGVAHSAIAGWLLLPPVAAVVDIGGLWTLYRTGLMAATHHDPALSGLVHLHMLAGGLLLSFAICQLDPVRRRRGPRSRALTLLATGTAHAVLARGLYAAGPPDTAFAASDLRAGAQIMYYGGDAVELVLASVLAAQWYAATGRRHRRHGARRGRASAGRTGAAAPRRAPVGAEDPSPARGAPSGL
ncbi:cytochrome c oxidase assembly protein [Streptomyces sp. NPDC058914]|uniref:cytochrome c oxidase assembly protein n=1 Tax=Streptomyces sp. NPDC058914 TaxID=3346671 RepID=UPI003686E3EF